MRPQRWVTVASYSTAMQASMAQGLLEEEGLTVSVRDAHMLTTDPLLAPGYGGVQVQVPETEAQRASELLAKIAAAQGRGGEASPERAAAGAPAEEHEQADGDEQDDDEPNPREVLASRAFFASWLGLVVPPFLLYAAYLLVRTARGSEPLRTVHRTRAWLAGVLITVAATILLVLGVMWLRGPQAAKPDARFLPPLPAPLPREPALGR